MQFIPSVDYSDPGPFLLETVRDFEGKYGLHLTIHDHQKLLYSPDGRPFLPNRDYHGQEYCARGRYENPEWNARCLEDCAFKVESASLQRMQPFIHHCWKGCSELIVPIERNHKPVLIFYAGLFRQPVPGMSCPDSIPVSLREVYMRLPVFVEAELVDLSRIVTVLGQGILYIAQSCRNHAKQVVPIDRKALIRDFVDSNAHKKTRLEDLAHKLCVSTSRAGHIVRTLFGYSFQALVLQERMTRARNLLISSPLCLKEISAEIGYRNEFYFNRVFRTFYDISPGAFRKRYLSRRRDPPPAPSRAENHPSEAVASR